MLGMMRVRQNPVEKATKSSKAKLVCLKQTKTVVLMTYVLVLTEDDTQSNLQSWRYIVRLGKKSFREPEIYDIVLV